MAINTFGPAHEKAIDEPVLTDQRNQIKNLMIDGKWRALFEIADYLNYPEASISAQLRHLRKEKFGGFVVDKRRREEQRLWEYRIRQREKFIFREDGQMEMC